MQIEDITTALKTYNQIEDKRDALRVKYAAKEEKLKDALAQVEQYLLAEMKRLGLTAFEAPGEGVATIKTKRRFGCGDWGVFWNWITENHCPNMLQKRILDSEMATYLEQQGGLPPGVSTEARLVIDVTKRPK